MAGSRNFVNSSFTRYNSKAGATQNPCENSGVLIRNLCKLRKGSWQLAVCSWQLAVGGTLGLIS